MMKHCPLRDVFAAAVIAASLGAASLGIGSAAAQQTAMTVSSPAFSDGGMLAQKNAASANDCGGQNVSPPLAWSGAPAGTRSYAIVMLDPDGGRGLGSIHWVAYGIAPSVAAFADGEGSAASAKFIGGDNSAGMTLYRGPCPPRGDRAHHYVIGVFALDLAPAALKPGLTRDQFLEAIRGHNLAEASIVGRYAR